ANRLVPTLTTLFRRSTLVFDDASARVTVDAGLRWGGADGRTLALGDGLLVLETKSAGRASPLDRALWRSGERPLKISKYGTGMAALHPELPANAWHRVLRTHIGVRR
ncbi:MAG: hypothetical protein KDB21_17245, partial [Acidimicrobiales bacterium]|nr:hypothetical protein [Acidimicrobiales bacterium]